MDSAVLSAIDQGVVDAKTEMAEVAKTTLSSNGLFGSRGFLKDNYMIHNMGAERTVRKFR